MARDGTEAGTCLSGHCGDNNGVQLGSMTRVGRRLGGDVVRAVRSSSEFETEP